MQRWWRLSLSWQTRSLRFSATAWRVNASVASPLLHDKVAPRPWCPAGSYPELSCCPVPSGFTPGLGARHPQARPCPGSRSPGSGTPRHWRTENSHPPQKKQASQAWHIKTAFSCCLTGTQDIHPNHIILQVLGLFLLLAPSLCWVEVCSCSSYSAGM